MNVERWRESFPVIAEEGRIHLNNCSVGAVPGQVLDARREFERIWIEAGNPWDAWVAKVDEAKARFAALIGAEPDEIAVHSCASAALAQVASAFDYGDRDEVVVTDLEFPTVPRFWWAQGKRGVEMRVAESPDGVRVPTDAYADAMSDDTRLVCSAHAYSNTGGLMDVEGVADAVHDRGGYLFLDAYQSAGAVPIDVDAMGVDMLVSGTVKFLLGGPGIAFLYVDSEVASELEPASIGWFGVEDVFDFESADPRYAEGARRFELGTPPTSNAYAASAGLEVIREVGIDAIRERVVEHTRGLIEGAEREGFAVRTPRENDHRGGVVNVQVAEPERAAGALLDRGFNVTARAGGVRLSPHFYNTAGEIEAAVEALAEVAEPR